jgi:hypothetical protein
MPLAPGTAAPGVCISTPCPEFPVGSPATCPPLVPSAGEAMGVSPESASALLEEDEEELLPEAERCSSRDELRLCDEADEDELASVLACCSRVKTVMHPAATRSATAKRRVTHMPLGVRIRNPFEDLTSS